MGVRPARLRGERPRRGSRQLRGNPIAPVVATRPV